MSNLRVLRCVALEPGRTGSRLIALTLLKMAQVTRIVVRWYDKDY
ncbi:hypothetical protein [Cupriavidus sp. 8B]